MEAALSQVRALALRTTTDNAVLVAALEALADTAAAHNHADADQYKLVLKACRDSEALGPLHGLINKLIGTEMAKKIATSLEGWKKALKKEGPQANSNNQQQQASSGSRTGSQGFMPPGPFGPYGGPPPHWPPFGNFRGRGRGRPQGPRPRTCYYCKSPDHLLMECPQIKK